MSTVAKKVIMGSGAVAEFGIDQSAILDNAGNAHLKRTPGTAGNRRTFTLSCWIKKTAVTANASIFTQGLHVTFDPALLQVSYYTAAGGHLIRLGTTAVFRDTAAWYHIVLAFDTTQGTATDRVKIYINGVRQTSFVSGQQTFPSQNLETSVNNTADVFYLGSLNATANSIGYLAETHFIDGTAKAASDFGETNDDTGQWIPKEYEGGSYGTNGFYLKFASGAIGTDSSGEGNDLTAVNLANSDVVTDTPNNNFCTLNSVDGGATFSEGNLKATTAASDGRRILATIGVESGKWYWEFKPLVNVANGIALGVTLTSDVTSGNLGASAAPAWGWYSQNTNDGYSVTSSSYAAIGPYMNADDVIGAALDLDNSTITFYKNGSAANVAITIPSSGLFMPVFGDGDNSAGSAFEVNFGQKTFAHTPPSGFSALSTANLPDPAIPLPSAHFNTVLYTGNETARSITGVGFEPSFVWIKERSASGSHRLFDQPRGVNKVLQSDNNSAELDRTEVTAFNADGFSLADSVTVNQNGVTHVSWNWKGNGSGSTDTSGDIDAVVSANQAAGFSIITWTGDGGAHTTVPHGLGVAPEIIFEKYRSAAGLWYTWVTAIDGTNDYLTLDTTNAAGDAGASGTPTSQFFSNWGSTSGKTNVAYAFASKPSFSKVGIYTGNGSADGPFVNCGFKPAWLMVKNITAAADWMIWDTKRNPSNEITQFLYPNLSADEGAGSNVLDLVSNGFKLRNAGTRNRNYNGDVYLYMAFAESPFKYANAR